MNTKEKMDRSVERPAAERDQSELPIEGTIAGRGPAPIPRLDRGASPGAEADRAQTQTARRKGR